MSTEQANEIPVRTRRLDRRLRRALVLAAGLIVGGAAAHAGVNLSLSAVDVAAGSTGNSLEVLLTNTGPAPIEIAAFSFELSTSSGDIRFTEANTALVSASYLFDGHSVFGPVISTSTGTTLDATDLYDILFAGAQVGAGSTLGLGHVSFDVVGSAGGSALDITLGRFPATSLSGSDTAGAPFDIPITTLTPKHIIITSSVPEAGSLGLTLAGLALLGLLTLHRRRGEGFRRRF